jgi:interferon gamma-inducible protein 30
MNNIKLFLILFIQICLCLTKVDVKIFYDSLCPDSIRFFINNVSDIKGSELYSKINLSIIPGALEKYEGDSLTCLHGESECSGNKLHACSLKILGKEEAIDYIICFMNNIYQYYKDVNQTSNICSNKHKKLEDCLNSSETDNYMIEMLDKKKNIDDKINFSPWVIINNYRPPFEDIRDDFISYLCKEINDNTISLCNKD